MALSAISPKLTFMGVILIVAGDTFLRCAQENPSDMAPLARYINMSAVKRKVCQPVIKSRLVPTLRSMALSAILPKAPFMRVIWGMAGKARLRRVLEVGNRACASMARATGSLSMTSIEREGQSVVIECTALCVQAIVAGQALPSKRRQVICHKLWFDLLVAIGAYHQIHCRYLAPVAILAGEIRSAGSRLMPS